MLFCPIYRLRLSPQPGGQAGWKGGSVSRSGGLRLACTRPPNPLPDFVERAYAVEIAAAGASDDRRQVLGELVVALSCARLQRDIEQITFYIDKFDLICYAGALFSSPASSLTVRAQGLADSLGMRGSRRLHAGA